MRKKPEIRSNLFSGPYYGPSAKKQVTYHGPAMRGVKRVLWRAGRFPWNNRFNEHFNIGLEKAI